MRSAFPIPLWRVVGFLLILALSLLLGTTLTVGHAASAQLTGWTPEAMMKVKNVANMQVSPDGHRVVFTVTEAIMTDATQGYAILQPNIRGSSGYGKQWRYANYKDWGGMDYQDLMVGVDHVIQMGVADGNRLGVMGWSYGGYMTSWVITHTQRFKAAAVGAGITNLMSFPGTTDILGFLPDYFGAELWENLDIYQEHSAMFNVKGVSTPTLIQHGEADARVPISQGYELYNALKRQNVPVKMVVYPRAPHGPQEPKQVLDIAKRNVEWFDHYLRQERSATKE